MYSSLLRVYRLIRVIDALHVNTGQTTIHVKSPHSKRIDKMRDMGTMRNAVRR